MTEEQMRALMAWIDARIDEKVEKAFGRDSLTESIHADGMKRAVEVEMGFSE